MHRAKCFSVAALFLILFTSQCLAQKPVTIEGKVLNDDGPSPGVWISLVPDKAIHNRVGRLRWRCDASKRCAKTSGRGCEFGRGEEFIGAKLRTERGPANLFAGPEDPLAAAVAELSGGKAALPDLRILSSCLRDKKEALTSLNLAPMGQGRLPDL